jgi:cyclopropane-fatty-acyl-phospholipid synthase
MPWFSRLLQPRGELTLAGDTVARAAFERAEPAGAQVPITGLAGLLHRKLAEKCANLPIAFDLVMPNGAVRRLGNGTRMFSLVFRNDRAVRAFASLDEANVAEAYFAGDFDIEGDMLSVLELRTVMTDKHPLLAVKRFFQPLFAGGQTRLNKQVISTHYDRDASFFLSFLDPQVPLYTHAIFERDDESLAEASLRKFAYCFEKCRLKPGDHMLEVGPGWGAWFNYASQRGVKCTGLTISRASIDYLEAMAKRAGYDWELIFADLLEYKTDRKYDAIVMMGVIEHLPQYEQVLAKFESLLKPGGRLYLDGSATASKKDMSSVIIKHIYPGNHTLMVLHDLLEAMTHTRLEVEEIFDDRHSYFLTFREWARNWEKNRKFIVERFGELDYRRFAIYLWAFTYNMRTARSLAYRMVFHKPDAPAS